MQWLNEPAKWNAKDDELTLFVEGSTDAWRKTHDGGIRDSAHFYYEEVTGDFEVSVTFKGTYATQYDQVGLMVRLDNAIWMKCGVEFFNGQQHVSAVVTRDYSDWSVVPLQNPPEVMHMRIVRSGVTLEVYYTVDGKESMLRQCYVTGAPTIKVGMACAAPLGEGFEAIFEGYKVTQ